MEGKWIRASLICYLVKNAVVWKQMVTKKFADKCGQVN